ncbi:MAG: SMC-Scp complex subunit ScpB, partial [Spirochaetaceae bacterium]|nr:SMC-Scp complex subunit ScpB [Spirochaetaceae bacterium]
IQYGTTKEVLKDLQLNSIDDLPAPDEKMIERFELAR